MNARTMKNPDEVLTQLSQLQDQDRAWLVGKLSTTQRAALMDLARVEGEASKAQEVQEKRAASASATEDARVALRYARPEEIAAMLADEPAWLVQTVLSLEEWRWKEEALQQLPQALRAAMSHQPAKPLPAILSNAIVEQCARHLPRYSSARPRTKMQIVLSRFGRFLVDRRLALRS